MPKVCRGYVLFKVIYFALILRYSYTVLILVLRIKAYDAHVFRNVKLLLVPCVIYREFPLGGQLEA